MFRFFTAGESHGPCLTAIVEGLPAGLALNEQLINNELARRQSGFGRGGRMQIEKDTVQILSGLRFGETLGSPLSLLIRNRDWENWQTRMAPFGPAAGETVAAPRPGHADLAGILKYGRGDVRDILERASARETAARVAAGAVAKQFLASFGLLVESRVIRIGGISMEKMDSRENAGLPDEVKAAVQAAREAGDTLGGVFEVTVRNMFPGLGSHTQWDRRLDTRLAGAVCSIPAIKGVEFGDGFGCAEMPGSMVHDEIYYADGRGYFRKTNHAGGMEGGISNGETLVVRAAMKPIPTLMRPLATVDIVSHQPVSASKERSDVCAVEAAAVVGEAMVAVVLADAVLEKFGGDCLQDLTEAVARYRQRIGW